MSNFCCINLKQNNLIDDFAKYNKFAKEIVQCALDNDLGVFFNLHDYASELITEAGMRDFFIISDSFLYKNCEFLDNTELTRRMSQSNSFNYKAAFFEKYGFLSEFIKIIFRYNVLIAEIYITEDNCDSVCDFRILESTPHKFLWDLCNVVIDSVKQYGGEFSTLKIVIKKE